MFREYLCLGEEVRLPSLLERFAQILVDWRGLLGNTHSCGDRPKVRDILPAACRSVRYVWGRIAWLFMGGWRQSNRKLNG